MTFTRPDLASPRWAGLPEPEEAGPLAILAYFGAYGPGTMEGFGMWLAGGWFGRRRLRTWFESVGDRLVEVEVEVGPERAYVLAADLDAVAATRPASAVRLLPGFDQYVLGPGTADQHVIPPGRRAAVSRQSGWISPVVVVGGVVRGTWELNRSRVRLAWFREAGRPPRDALESEVARLASVLDRGLELAVSLA